MSNDTPIPAPDAAADTPADIDLAATLRELGPANHANALLLSEAFMLMARARRGEHAA